MGRSTTRGFAFIPDLSTQRDVQIVKRALRDSRQQALDSWHRRRIGRVSDSGFHPRYHVTKICGAMCDVLGSASFICVEQGRAEQKNIRPRENLYVAANIGVWRAAFGVDDVSNHPGHLPPIAFDRECRSSKLRL